LATIRRALLNAPDPATLRGLRDRAILSTLLYHGLRRAELCALTVGDLQPRRGVMHLRVHGKGDKLRFVPLHPGTAELIGANVIDGRPRFAKLSINDGKKVKIAAIDPDFY
jgi:integrase